MKVKGTGESNKINNVEALKLEFGDNGGKSVVGSRKVVIGTLYACTKRVPPAKWDLKAGPTSLFFTFFSSIN